MAVGRGDYAGHGAFPARSDHATLGDRHGQAAAGRFGDAPDMMPEEHQRRGNATDALFREIVRQATGNP